MSSSPISSVSAAQSDSGLLRVLASVPDPRALRGTRYPLASMLLVAVSAVLAGARSFIAIGEWSAELDSDQLARLQITGRPVESTLRKLFARLDAAALDTALAAWAWTRVRDVAGRRVIAIDGKTLRGARRAALTAAPHLIAALDHVTGVVVGFVGGDRGGWPCQPELAPGCHGHGGRPLLPLDRNLTWVTSGEVWP